MQSDSNTLYLLYDRECILCKSTALAFRIRDAVGRLAIINARDSHPIVDEARQKGYDLNEGILVKFHNEYYYGPEALHFLALVGSSVNLLNKLNVLIFSSKSLSRFCYPILKFIRNILLYIRGTPYISTSKQPLINLIFGISTAQVPQILQKRYSLIPYSTGRLVLKGKLNISTLKIFSIFASLFKFIGSLPFYPEKNIPVTVELIAEQSSDKIAMNRAFYYHNRPIYYFNSQIIHIQDNIVFELMKFSLAVKLMYRFDGNKINMDYGGYYLRFGRWLIPLPLGWVIGKFSAYEEAIDETKFNMQVSLHHPVFGKIYQYDGVFQIEDVNG